LAMAANSHSFSNQVRGPIFVGGPDRCGKTTLQAFLSSHPNIAIPAVGSNFWSYFYDQYGDLHSKENFERCLDAMMHYKHALFLKPDAERIRREFWQGEPSYARLFALLHEHYAERIGKPRWGDQTGLIERYADPIFKAYPGAKMLHMLRDPRDRYEASLEMWPDGKGRVGAATGRWLYSARLAQQNMQRYPKSYLIVRFETLVNETEATLRQVCSFLGEEYTPEMLAMGGSLGHRSKVLQGTESTGGAVILSARFIGRYRNRLTKEEVAFMQTYAGRQMAAFDYDRDPVRFFPSERARYALISHPANLARMTVWLARETLQQKFPGAARRRPSQAMLLPSGAGETGIQSK
jgi:hypothetical protein